MKAVKFSEDIVPIGEFKSQSAQWLEKVKQTGHPVVITQNGKPAGVIISPVEFDRLMEKELFVDSVNKGLSDADAGRVVTTKEIQSHFTKRRKNKAVK
tara:strand:+ start:243 stop:536 length:294 start_codon:yes stop_codon:yes gene_type:complete